MPRIHFLGSFFILENDTIKDLYEALYKIYTLESRIIGGVGIIGGWGRGGGLDIVIIINKRWGGLGRG